MFIKLQYTANKPIFDCFRTINAIINDTSITSATVLATKFIDDSYHADFKTSYDAANSTIIRTNDLSTTKSHFCTIGPTAGRGNYRWTLEFSVPDALSRKVYMQYASTTNEPVPHAFLNVGDQITGGDMSSSQTPITSTTTSATATGTQLILAGNSVNAQTNDTIVSDGTIGGYVRTFWVYITDKAFVWCGTQNQDTNTGFGTTYNNNTTFIGPYINSMYTRYDYWNKDSNGIIPWYYTNTRGASIGYGMDVDFSGTFNAQFTTNQTTGEARVFNLVDAVTKISTSFPTIYHPLVNHRIGHRSNYAVAHLSRVTGTTTSITTGSYGKTVTTTANERYPSADLDATTFINHPIGWDNWYEGCHGGNVSEESGVYLFNGDYQPGDTYSVGGKVYMIWPMYQNGGYTNRLGLSVPME